MKKFFLFFVVALATCLCSCGGDDEDDPNVITPTESEYKHGEYAKLGSVKYFRYPCFDWNANISTVKKYMSGYTLNSSSTSTKLTYDGKYKELATMYSFENGVQKSNTVFIEATSIDTEVLITMLKEDYTYVDKDESENMWYFVSKDKKNFMGLSLTTVSNTIYYLIIWVQHSSSASPVSRSTISWKEQLDNEKEKVLIEYEKLGY